MTKTVSPGTGPCDVEALLAQALDGRLDDVDILPAEQTAFARMRIERRDGDAPARKMSAFSASSVRARRGSMRSGVTRFGTSSSAVCVVMWLTRMWP